MGLLVQSAPISLSVSRLQPSITVCGIKRRFDEVESEDDDAAKTEISPCCSSASSPKSARALGIKRQRRESPTRPSLPRSRTAPLQRVASPLPAPSDLTPPSSPTAKTSPPAAAAAAGKKLKTRTAMQAIHIRALEHGLRVPVSNTPLGIADLAENIICTLPSPAASPGRRALSALPAMAVPPRRINSGPSFSARPRCATTTDQSSTAPRPIPMKRRNTISCIRADDVPLLDI
ncbi:hypothetical protein GGI04_000521 [Coemansia thaxteri]|nr:hypothetical protein GGI04_000521 [Coemansia thaxteri]